ncbi:hypothetical protein R3P38DRAFT_3487116 [Favolaschia claudopus]|uniref:Uncharacterized protein n=1 Tax=Favolaschia claudopus TaxID=2862362 RepID=A0AAV9Z663_9AGAR
MVLGSLAVNDSAEVVTLPVVDKNLEAAADVGGAEDDDGAKIEWRCFHPASLGAQACRRELLIEERTLTVAFARVATVLRRAGGREGGKQYTIDRGRRAGEAGHAYEEVRLVVDSAKGTETHQRTSNFVEPRASCSVNSGLSRLETCKNLKATLWLGNDTDIEELEGQLDELAALTQTWAGAWRKGVLWILGGKRWGMSGGKEGGASTSAPSCVNAGLASRLPAAAHNDDLHAASALQLGKGDNILRAGQGIKTGL